MQVERTKQTIKKVVHYDASLTERICTLFSEQGITIISVLTVFYVTMATIILPIKAAFIGEGGPATSGSPKAKGG